MKTTIVACKTLETELRFVMKKTGIDYPVEWIESGLHNVPKNLNRRLQDILDGITAQRVLIALGFCGNSVQDVKAGNFELIIPRVDDCISLLLGSTQARTVTSSKLSAYFLTEGWLRGERNLWVEYLFSVEKYGEEEAQSIAEMMFGNYRTLALLNSGVEPIEQLIDKTRIIASKLGLEQIVIPATVAYLEELLTGPWEDRKFLIKAPWEQITAKDVQLECSCCAHVAD
jgi:hypothetical protein